MSRFKLPDDQPDFEIELTVTGKDSEGQPADVAGLTIEVDNSNEIAIVGTLGTTTPSEDGKSLKATVSVHVADPSPDLGIIGYKALNADGDIVGAGSDEFLVGAGTLAVATITSSVPLTPEPEA